jgi:hypothetical protein
MIRGAIIAVICLGIGGYFGYEFAFKDFAKQMETAIKK